jgi:hypothetical protein
MRFGTDDEELEVSETGSTVTIWANFASEPTSNAVLSIVSTDTGEVTASPSTLTFTTSNWETKQTIVFTGVDDTELDGDQDVRITVIDSYGRDIFQDPVLITVEDDDGLDWHLERYGVEGDVLLSETGSTYAFYMNLWSQPGSDAVLSIVSDDTGEVTVSPSTLTFTSSNWQVLQTVTLTGVDDDADDGSQTTTVTVSGVGELWMPEGETLQVVTADDDNSAPEAVDNTVNWLEYIAGGYDIESLQGITFDVGGNDTDADGHALTIISATNGANGTIDLVSGFPHRLTYNPDGTFPALDTFTYTVSDGYGGTDTATVSVTYNPS